MLAVAGDVLSVLNCKNFDSKDLSKGLERIKETNALNAKLTSVCWNHSNQVVATSNVDRTIQLWQVSNVEPLTTIPFDPSESVLGEIKQVKFSNNSRYVAAASNKEILLWDLKKRILKSRFMHNGILNAIGYFQDIYVVGGDNAGDLRFWDLKTETNVFSSLILYPTLNSPIECIAVQAIKPNYVFCGRRDGTIQIFDTLHFKLIRNLNIFSSSGITDLSLSPRNPKLLTAVSGMERKVSLIDVQGGSSASSSEGVSPGLHPAVSSIILPVGEGSPNCVCCHENGFHIAVGSSNGIVLVYDWRDSKAPVCRYAVGNGTGGGIRSLSFAGIVVRIVYGIAI